MTRNEMAQQAQWLADESKTLAAAFRPSASDGNVIRVPVAMCARLAEILEQMSAIMVVIAKDVAIPIDEAK